MVLLSSIEKKKMPKDAVEISALLNNVVHIYDPAANVILFGSRARGDADSESDWDFLVLTERNNTDLLLRELIPEVRKKIESVYSIVISLLVKNKNIWEEEYRFTNIYESILEDGIAL